MDMIDKILRGLDERDMTQGELESSAGLPRNRISRWKAGTGEPTASQALRIARVLGVSVEYLVDDELTVPVAEHGQDVSRILWLAGELGYDVAVQRLTLSPDVFSASRSYAETRKKPPPGSARNRDGGKGGA